MLYICNTKMTQEVKPIKTYYSMKAIIVYRRKEWYFRKYNQNLKMFKGITKEEERL